MVVVDKLVARQALKNLFSGMKWKEASGRVVMGIVNEAREFWREGLVNMMVGKWMDGTLASYIDRGIISWSFFRELPRTMLLSGRACFSTAAPNRSRRCVLAASSPPST
jgi:hypothetical protein